MRPLLIAAAMVLVGLLLVSHGASAQDVDFLECPDFPTKAATQTALGADPMGALIFNALETVVRARSCVWG